MSTLPSFFPPHHSQDNNLFNFSTLLNIMPFRSKLELTNEGSRKLGHYLLIYLWSFIVESDKLFKIRVGFENSIKLLRRYCLERNLEFSHQFCNGELFFDQEMELLSGHSRSVIDVMDREEYDGQKKIKLDEQVENFYSMIEYSDQLTRKFLFGELHIHAMKDVEKKLTNYKNGQEIKNCINLERIKSLVLTYLEYDPSLVLKQEDRDENLIFHAMNSIIDYLAAEIIEFAGNMAIDLSSPLISHSSMQNIIVQDEELRRTMFYGMNMMPITDLKYFYGYEEEIPQISIHQKLDEIEFCNIPSEIHSLFLEHFDSLHDLLGMRLVCKQWNYFIMNDQMIWKKLTCHSMISERIFRYCDNSLTLEEMDQILERGKKVKPLSMTQQIINHCHEKKDWKNLYFLLVHQHLRFLKDVNEMYSKKYFQNQFDRNDKEEESFHKSKERIQIGISEALTMYPDELFPKRVDDCEIMIPKDQSEVFSNIDSRMILLAIIDFSQYSCFMSCRKFPQHGLLYCFHRFYGGKKSEFLYFENLSSDSLIPFTLSEDTFTKPMNNEVLRKQEQVIVNLESPSSVFYLQNAVTEGASSLAPCFTFNELKGKWKNFDPYREDRIVLYSGCATILDSETIVFSISISMDDLKRRDFSQAKIDSLLE